MASTAEVEEKPSPSIYISEEWSEAAETIAYDSITSPSPIALICGARNCGKSTFSRYLINVLLKRYRKVAYLDTDVGQPEFTAPGFLSFTVVDTITPDLAIPCLKTPERCFFFGDVSSKRDPTTYLKCICTLYDYYQKEYRMFDSSVGLVKTELPLVVNTPGWVKGVGYDTLVNMLRYMTPTHVVKINISSKRKNLPAGMFWLEDDSHGEVNLLEISARQDSSNRLVLVQKEAHLLRDLRIMAYFRQCFPSNSNITTIKELANALASHPPYQVPISSIKIRHLHCQVLHSETFYGLNASIVGLAISSEQSGDLPRSVGLALKNLYGISIPFDAFIDPGIVRGIDTLKGLLYVITPVPLSILQKVDLLLQGFIQIPTCLLQVQGCISPYMSTSVLPSG